MPLRERSAFYEWGGRENPKYLTWQIVNLWIERLELSPWQAPSTPFPELSDLPQYEVRVAEVPNSDGVEVFYRREFIGEIVDLIWDGRLPTK